MDGVERDPSSHWPEATFPSKALLEEFLRQVRLWNRVEGLPTIEFEPLADGLGIRFFTADPRRRGILRLIDSFGGSVPGDVGRPRSA